MSRALGKEFPCRDCGTPVRWSESKSGSRYLAQRKDWSGTDTWTTLTFWPSHRCIPNPEWQAAVADQRRVEEERKAVKEAAASAGIVAPEGRVRDVAGTVVKVVNKGEGLGYTEWKMTVLTDEGWSCWMSVPQSLQDYTGLFGHSGTRPTVEEGSRVVFTATCTRSDRDALFAFGKRPVVTVAEEVSA